MKRILLLMCVLVGSLTYAQGHETFDNLGLSGSGYTAGTFVGDDGINWEYSEARGDIELNGAAITLGRNRPNPMFLKSDLISNGIGNLEFSYMQAFSTDVNLEVLVNGQVVYTATSSGEKDVIKSSGVIQVDVSGNFVLTFNNPDGAGQVTIDDIVWTDHGGTVGTEDYNQVAFSYYPNPMGNVLNLNSNSTILNVEAFNVLGQRVINNTHYKGGRVDTSSLISGAYIFQVTFEDGSRKTFKVMK